MATFADANPLIAGIGHIYAAPVDSTLDATKLDTYKFTGTDKDLPGWTWLGDMSSENMPEFSSDGGDATSKRTWDRTDLRVTHEAKTHSLTIRAVTTSADTMQVAFPGSTYDEQAGMWTVNLNGTVEKALLIVVVDGDQVAAHLFPKVSLSGAMPSLDLEEFSEIEITGSIMAGTNGEKYYFYTPRQVKTQTSGK